MLKEHSKTQKQEQDPELEKSVSSWHLTFTLIFLASKSRSKSQRKTLGANLMTKANLKKKRNLKK